LGHRGKSDLRSMCQVEKERELPLLWNIERKDNHPALCEKGKGKKAKVILLRVTDSAGEGGKTTQ